VEAADTSIAETPVTSKRALGRLLLPFLLIIIIVIADQWVKVWVKTHMAWREQINLIGDWFLLHYTENNGMAFGIELGGRFGKLALTAFRISAVIFGIWFLFKQVEKKAHKGFLICIALIIAGAIGNIIDSVFYGVIFKDRNFYPGGWFEGHVVDMFYAPIWESTFPTWFPVWGGESFTFFGAIWNIADAAISIGVISILVFQRIFFPPAVSVPTEVPATESASESEINLPETDNNNLDSGKADEQRHPYPPQE
jgi:signal peptidase II